MSFEIFNKSNFASFKPKLDNFFAEFTKSQDKLAQNYKINYQELDEITLIIKDKEIVAFSSVLYRDVWPNNSRRIFNRLIRNKSLPWSDRTFGTISKIMHDEQINYCKKNEIDFVFLSIQGKKQNWLKRWCNQANMYSPGWKQLPGMVRVCNGRPESCIQHIAYKNISGTDKKFNFYDKLISYQDYAELILQSEE